MFSAPGTDEEWRKQLTSVLLEGATVVVIDNVTRRLDSPDLCKVLTEQIHADRILGKSEIVSLPVSCSWFATGNNVQLGGDIFLSFFYFHLLTTCHLLSRCQYLLWVGINPCNSPEGYK
jgi:hypothetical protein